MDLDNPSLVGNHPAFEGGTLGQVVGTPGQVVGNLGQLDTLVVAGPHILVQVVQNPHQVVRSPELEDNLHRQQEGMESSSWQALEALGVISCLYSGDLLHVGVTKDS